tara:strand:- start:4576 stop:5706 length:1131 start_codon:yes stop_codon:yes gene_type:complete
MLKLLKQTINTLISIQVSEEFSVKAEREVLMDLLENNKKYHDRAITDIAIELNVARGTVIRWLELKNVPTNYRFDLMKMCDIEIDYTQYSFKDKDQFFTTLDMAKQCYDVFKNKLKELGEIEEDYNYIEPSAGAGVFLDVLPSKRTIGIDIEPKRQDVMRHDYLTWLPEEKKKYVVFGNPPFGLRGHLALKFINHSAKFSDYVCFILPQFFESDGKGSPRKRIKDYNLIHSAKSHGNFVYPDGKEVVVNTIFQIWSKNHHEKAYDIEEIDESVIKVYSLSNGSLPSQQRNTNMLYKCDVYIPSTCFGKDNMKAYSSFQDLPGEKGYGIIFKKKQQEMFKKAMKVKWDEIAFLSTNSALNLRTSYIYKKLINIFDNL